MIKIEDVAGEVVILQEEIDIILRMLLKAAERDKILFEEIEKLKSDIETIKTEVHNIYWNK
jgi:chromosome segregation ATPase